MGKPHPRQTSRRPQRPRFPSKHPARRRLHETVTRCVHAPTLASCKSRRATSPRPGGCSRRHAVVARRLRATGSTHWKGKCNLADAKPHKLPRQGSNGTVMKVAKKVSPTGSTLECGRSCWMVFVLACSSTPPLVSPATPTMSSFGGRDRGWFRQDSPDHLAPEP